MGRYFVKRDTATVAGLALLAFTLGAYRLGSASFGFDEGFSVYVARMGLPDELRYLAAWDAHPPLHYFLLHFWIRIAGDSELAARLPGIGAAVLLVPLLYQTANRLAGRQAGLFAAIFGSSNALLIFYAREARMYSIATASALLALYFVGRTLESDRRPLHWLGLLVAILLCVYTLYYTVFPLAFLGLVVVGRVTRTTRGWRACVLRLVPYLAITAIAAAIFLPWLPSFAVQAQSTGPGAWRTFVGPLEMLATTWRALVLGATASVEQPLLAIPGWIALAVAIGPPLLVRWRRGCAGESGATDSRPSGLNPADRSMLAAWALCAWGLVIPLALIQAVSSRQPIFHERYVTVLVPAFALLVGVGLAALRRTSLPAAAVTLAVLLVAQASAVYNLYYEPRYASGDYRTMVGYLRANLWPGDVVLLSSGTSYPIFKYYFPEREGWRGPLQSFPGSWDRTTGPAVVAIGTVDDVPGRRLSTPEDLPQSPGELKANLARTVARTRRVWYLRVIETVTDRRGAVHDWLDRHLFETEMRWFAGKDYLQLYRYATRRPPAYDLPSTAIPANVQFANGAAIKGYELSPPEPRPGEQVVLTIYWQAQQPIANDYQVFAHLVDHEGQLIAQFDGPPLSGRYPTSRWQPDEVVRDEYLLRIPAGLSIGIYHFQAGQYELDTLQRSPKVDGSGAAPVGELVVRPGPPAGDSRQQLAVLGRQIALQSHHIAPSQGQIELTLQWRALDNPPADYKAFVHLLDDSGQIVAQQDSEPLRGRFPTSKWQAGDVVEDRLLLAASPGRYRIALGLYEPATMRRLPVDGRDDGRIILGPFELIAPAGLMH